jgi:alkanesulfonate monooxygenase SsuD/methylene tetrahydromethanopterin reductase-like flavin-dependent oxidoreductase (luciferase family)
MKFGYAAVNSADGIHPGILARELEQRGFESLWAPEHSHMPVASVGLYPDPRMAMPSGYAHIMNPFLALMAAVSTTSKLKVGTGICLVLEHDLMDLACTTATLDVLSNSRFILGIGAGWNVDELRNHRPELAFSQRYSALKERVAALRAAWSFDTLSSYQGLFSDIEWGKQISSFAGEYDRFTPSWVFPKPKGGAIPIAMGLAGPLGVRYAAVHADIWSPVDVSLLHEGKLDVAGRIESFRDLVEQGGRDPAHVPITLFAWGGESDRMLDRYASLGVERTVFAPPDFNLHSEAATLRRLDALTKYIERH